MLRPQEGDSQSTLQKGNANGRKRAQKDDRG